MAMPEIKMIPIDEIRVPQVLQRHFNPKHAQEIAEHFNINSFGVITVCKIKNSKNVYVVDGRHRMYGAKKNGILAVPCYILPILSDEEIARIFREIDKRTKMNPIEILQSEIRSNEQDAITIQAICNKYNVPIGPDGEKHQIRGFYLRAINIVRQILMDYGADRLEQTMRITVSAWPGQPHAMYEAVIYGVALFLEYFGNQETFDEKRAIKQFSKQTAEIILKEGKERRRNRGAIPAIEIANYILRNMYNYRVVSERQLRPSPKLDERAFRSAKGKN